MRLYLSSFRLGPQHDHLTAAASSASSWSSSVASGRRPWCWPTASTMSSSIWRCSCIGTPSPLGADLADQRMRSLGARTELVSRLLIARLPGDFLETAWLELNGNGQHRLGLREAVARPAPLDPVALMSSYTMSACPACWAVSPTIKIKTDPRVVR